MVSSHLGEGLCQEETVANRLLAKCDHSNALRFPWRGSRAKFRIRLKVEALEAWAGNQGQCNTCIARYVARMKSLPKVKRVAAGGGTHSVARTFSEGKEARHCYQLHVILTRGRQETRCIRTRHVQPGMYGARLRSSGAHWIGRGKSGNTAYIHGRWRLVGASRSGAWLEHGKNSYSAVVHGRRSKLINGEIGPQQNMSRGGKKMNGLRSTRGGYMIHEDALSLSQAKPGSGWFWGHCISVVRPGYFHSLAPSPRESKPLPLTKIERPTHCHA
jgi:hypothetical protein